MSDVGRQGLTAVQWIAEHSANVSSVAQGHNPRISLQTVQPSSASNVKPAAVFVHSEQSEAQAPAKYHAAASKIPHPCTPYVLPVVKAGLTASIVHHEAAEQRYTIK